MKKYIKIPVYYYINEETKEMHIDDIEMINELNRKIKELIEENNKFLNC
jgi:hypothetical protein